MNPIATSAVIVGTRGSTLAVTQTGIVCAALQRAHPGLAVETERITTTGDVQLDAPLSTLGERGVFVTALEEALRDGRIDLAVHSAKDLPSELSPGMRIAAFLPRADARDAIVSQSYDLWTLPPHARVGSSSPRRMCQLRALRRNLEILDVRGNVDTRIRKMESGQYDALLLAVAGLERLGLVSREGLAVMRLSTALMLPAPGQGALAIEVSGEREDLIALLAPLQHAPTATAVLAERAFLAEIGGGCASAIAAYAEVYARRIRLRGMIGSTSGRLVRGEVTGDAVDGGSLARRLARDLLARGGTELLAS